MYVVILEVSYQARAAVEPFGGSEIIVFAKEFC